MSLSNFGPAGHDLASDTRLEVFEAGDGMVSPVRFGLPNCVAQRRHEDSEMQRAECSAASDPQTLQRPDGLTLKSRFNLADVASLLGGSRDDICAGACKRPDFQGNCAWL